MELRKFKIGQIVKWKNDLWIIAEVLSNNDGLQGLQLIASRESNITAYPTLTWPNKETGVKAVKILADCMESFYINKVKIIFR